jgi:gamma-glutamyltranspeptidase / glutathione hydrolase
MRRILVPVAFLALLIVPAAQSATSNSNGPYALAAQALLGGDQTDIYLAVSSDGAPVPDTLEKVQLKAFSLDGRLVSTQNFFDVAAPDGAAALHQTGFDRGQVLQVKAHVKAGNQNNVEAEARIRLRPDLTVAGIDAPARVVRKQPFGLTASIGEIGGDTGADAIVSVFDGSDRLAAQTVALAAGGAADVAFTLRLSDARQHTLRVEVSGADPDEYETSNNSDSAPISVRMYDGDGVVATEEWHATDVGAEILRQGGNAIDAAAAVQFALNVTMPHLTGIGGGSTILVHLADGQNFAIDARERAPAAATPTMFVGKSVLNQSGCTVGVPGTLLAVQTMLDRWGTMSLAQTLEPATMLAQDGFPVGEYLALATADRRNAAAFQPEARAVFRQPDGSALPIGYWLRQPDLAKTFRLIATQGASAFYRGEIAPAVVAAQTRTRSTGCEGGMTIDDLARYAIKIGAPISASYRGYEVATAPPSSSGGLVLLQALKLAQRFPLGDPSQGYGPGAGKTLNVDIEALRLALADRTMWMGDDDPTFGSPICVNGLLSSDYTALRSGMISDNARIPVATPGNPCAFESTAEPVEFDEAHEAHTTHFSIVDKWGNMVSFTTTLTDGFGTAIMVPGYGFVLNDSLSNFNLSPKRGPGNPGTNDPAPNRRAMGSTAPVLIFKDGEPLVATGAPGAGWIPSMVFQVVSNVLDQGMPIQQAVNAPRFWFDSTQINTTIAWNPGFPPESIAYLRGLRQPLAPLPAPGRRFGVAQSLQVDPVTFKLSGASDQRSPDGSAIVLP